MRKAKKHTPKEINSGKAWEGCLGTRQLDDNEEVKNSIRKDQRGGESRFMSHRKGFRICSKNNGTKITEYFYLKD